MIDMIEIFIGPKDLSTGMEGYRMKPVEIRAKKMESHFEIASTSTKSGSFGKAGDWMVFTKKGYFYSVADSIFSEMYEKIETKGETKRETDWKLDKIPVTKEDMKEGASVFRKRPLQVSAKQLHYNFSLDTKEGLMAGRPGDWVIEGFYGELSFCRDEDFQNFYQYEQPKENSDKDP